MALNTRLTQNIDLQADGSVLLRALQSVGTEINKIVAASGKLNENLKGGASGTTAALNGQLRVLQQLVSQATGLQNILDATLNQRTARGKGLLDEQSLGRQSAAVSKLSRDITSTSTATEALEKRLTLLNTRFAELGRGGQSVSRNDLSKQLRIQEALTQVNQLQGVITRLNGKSLNTPSGGSSSEMTRLRGEIERINNELLRAAQNTRRSTFQPQIDQIRALTDQYQKLIAAEIREAEVNSTRGIKANSTAQGILAQTDAQRLAQVKSGASQFAFPAGISNTVSQKTAEDQLAAAMNRRLSILALIEKAQERGASTAVVERLNQAYTKVNSTMSEQVKLLSTIQAEQKKTFLGQVQTGLGYAGKIAGASVAVQGVFAVINAVQSGVKFVVDYEAALKSLQAISGSTDTQMRQLAGGIEQVSRNSNRSVLEITKAAQTIAQAGYSASETAQVLQSALTLSTAAGVDPNQGADVITSTLGAFQLQASESARVADVLVTALNRTKLSLDQVQAAVQYAGATAKESNVSFDELTTIIASLAQAGIRSGSTIGTGLRQLFVELQTPTEEFKKSLKDVGLTLGDVDIKTKGFAEVVRTLSDAGFTATQAYTSFQTRAAAAFLAFKGQLPTYDELALSIANGGAAAEAQSRAMDSLGAQYQRLKNDLSILVSDGSGPVVNSLKLLTEIMAGLIETISDLLRPFGQLIDSMGLFGSLIQTVVLTSIGAMFGPVGALIGLFVGLANAMGSTSSKAEELETKTSEAAAALTSQHQTVTSLDEAIGGLIDRQGSLKDGSITLQTETTTLANRFSDLYGYLGKSTVGYNDLLEAMLRYRNEALKTARLQADTLRVDAQVQLTDVNDRLAHPGLGSTLRSGVDPAKLGGRGSESLSLFEQGTAAQTSNDVGSLSTTINKLNAYSSKHNDVFRSLISVLNERLALLNKARQLQTTIDSATRTIGVDEAASSPEESRRFGLIQNARGQVNNAINGNGNNPAARRTDINRLLAVLKRETTFLQDRIKTVGPQSAQGQVLGSDLSLVQEQVSRLNTTLRQMDEDAKKYKPDTARKGLNLTSGQVAANIRVQFPGSNVYGTGRRSLAEQTVLYNKYKAGQGPLAAKPGQSMHGNDRAIDITPIPGSTIDDVVAYVEGLGLEVTERLIERNPKTGALHWHIGWKPKTSSFQRGQDTGLEELQRAARGKKVDATNTTIQAILADAKAGTDTPANLTARFNGAMIAYGQAQLAQYDGDHPAGGLYGAALKAQQEGRADLQTKIEEQAKKFYADLSRAISDAAAKTYDDAIADINKRLADETYNNQQVVRDQASTEARAGNRVSARHNADTGTQYYLQKQREAAQLNADRATSMSQSMALIEKKQTLDTFAATNPNLPANSETQIAFTEKLRKAQDDYNNSLREHEALLQSIIDRTTQFQALPIEQRLKSGAQAWLENSGAMDSYKDVLANNVGPALDMVTSQLTDMFTKLATGQATLKQALLGMIQAIGQFILQLIAKALALAAVKWFLKLIGVPVPDGLMGGGQAKGKGINIAKQMTGGRAGEPMKLIGGGPILDGVANRDSVPALLARKEFVLRSPAVDSIGVKNVEDMNRHGMAAVKKMGQTNVIAPQAKQEVNVYVVKPEEKPQLGKSDIVLAITDDMLQGGVTKTLVKRISQGSA